MAHNNMEMRSVGGNQPQLNQANNNGNLSQQSHLGGNSSGSLLVHYPNLLQLETSFYDPLSKRTLQPYPPTAVDTVPQGGGGHLEQVGNMIHQTHQDQTSFYCDTESSSQANQLNQEPPSLLYPNPSTPYSPTSGLRPQQLPYRHQLDRIPPSIIDPQGHVSMLPDISIHSMPQQLFDHQQLNQVPLTPEPSIPSSSLYTPRYLPLFPNESAFLASSSLNPPTQHVSTVVTARVLGPDHQGFSPSYNNRKEASYQDWVHPILPPIKVNTSQRNGDQNLTAVSNPWIPQMGSVIINRAYDPIFAELGKPVDPHLRMFMERQMHGNHGHP